MLGDTASPLELVWTIPAAVATLVAGWLLILSIGDEVHRRRIGINGIVRLDIQKSIVTAAVLTFVLCSLAVIGSVALVTPPNPNLVRDPTTAATAVATAVLLVGANLALTSLAAYLLLQRGAILRELQGAARRDRRETDAKKLDGALD
jgi:hypothetical protein